MKAGKTDEWYTPKFIFDALGVEFDLDPCHPEGHYFVPAKRRYTKTDNGLAKPWKGRVWMNPPFGKRNGQFPWVERFIEHGNGIGLFTSLTSSKGFQKFIPAMDAVVFPKGKTRFIKPNGKQGGVPYGRRSWRLYGCALNTAHVRERSARWQSKVDFLSSLITSFACVGTF